MNCGLDSAAVGRLPGGQGHSLVHIMAHMVHPQLVVPYSCPTGWRGRANRSIQQRSITIAELGSS
jgi:hypothetical protein